MAYLSCWKDVATIGIGLEIRRVGEPNGIGDRWRRDRMRYGQNALETLHAVKAKLSELQKRCRRRRRLSRSTIESTLIEDSVKR